MQMPAHSPERFTASEPAPPAAAFVLDSDSEGILRKVFGDIGLVDARVRHGGIDTAIETYVEQPTPPLLVVDVSGVADPMLRMNRLADIVDPKTEVIVVGDKNDIVLYRDLKALGVAEYFFKPLVSSLMARACGSAGTDSEPRLQRSGKLILVLGVRGGVGASTIAVASAWKFAESHERRVLFLDLDLQGGDAALQLDMSPSHALREALEHPDRVDELFLERGITHVTPRLDLFAGLEPLSDSSALSEEAVLKLLPLLLVRYRYVFVDLPDFAAVRMSGLLHLPNTVLLVSDGGLASARDVVRWRERIGPNSPERATLHVLNKAGAPGGLPSEEFLRAVGTPPDIVIPYDKDIPAAAIVNINAVSECSAMKRGIGALSRQLIGRAEGSAPKPSLLTRLFQTWV